MRLFKKIAIFSCFFCFLAPFARAQSTSFTLNQSIEYALQNNWFAQNKTLDQAIAKKVFLRNLGLLMPDITANFNYLYNTNLPVFSDKDGNIVTSGVTHQSLAEVVLKQTIFDAQVFEKFVIAKENKQLEQYQRQKVGTDIVVAVKQAFYALLAAKKQEEMAISSIERLEKAIADARLRYKNGLIQQVDVDRIQVLLNNAQTEHKKIRRQIPFQENWLKFQINLDLEENIRFEGDLIKMLEEENLARIQDLQPETHIDTYIAQQNVKMAKVNFNYAKLKYIPELSLVGAYRYNFFNNNFSPLWSNAVPVSFIGLNLNFPIFQGFTKGHQLKIQKFELRKSENTLAQTEQKIHLNIQESRNNFLNSWDDYNNQEANINLATLNFQNISYQVNNGIRSSLEILDAQESLKNAEVLYIQSIYQVLMNTTLYEKSLGKKLYHSEL